MTGRKTEPQPVDSAAPSDDLEARRQALEDAERAIARAYASGKAERSKITQVAQLTAAEAVALTGVAVESDAAADEAGRITIIAERSGDKAAAKKARQQERIARRKAAADHNAATRAARRAYDAIRFSAPQHLGFMRFVQVICALHIVVALITLVLTSRDTIIYTSQSIIDWFLVVFDSVAFWLFINRYKITRPFMIASASFGVLAPLIYDLAIGQFNIWGFFFYSAYYLLLIFYFIFSRRVKASMVNTLARGDGDYERRDASVARSGWPFVRNLIIYFIVFSVLGHWLEMGFCELVRLGLVQGDYDPSNTMLWRDWLFPFSMEGAAVVIIALFLYPLWMWLRKKTPNIIVAAVVSFLVNMFLCSAIEFCSGLIVNADLTLWNYSDMPFNIMGQVCLQNALGFGVAASVITWFVYPLLERLIARVPRDVMNIVFVVVAAFGALIYSMYVIDLSGLNQHVDVVFQQAEETAWQAPS